MTEASSRSAGHGPLEREPGDCSLQQALDLCATSCLEQWFNAAPEGNAHPVWMRLYAASERLKRAVHDGDVCQAILEISSNLIGCEEIAILELREPSGLSLLAGCGISGEHQEALALHAGEVALAIKQDEITTPSGERNSDDWRSRLGITAFVPIWHNRKARGAIVLYRLLPQRTGLDAADDELLLLLSIFSGPALFHHAAE